MWSTKLTYYGICSQIENDYHKQIPNLPINHITEQQFISKLLQLLPQFEIYAVSFMIVYLFCMLQSLL